MTGLGALILRVGQKKSVLLITLAALTLALLVTGFILTFLFHIPPQEKIKHLKVAIIVSLIVAPLVAYEVVDLLFKINVLEKEMRNFATYDPLTGLFNRRIFYELTEHQLRVARREKSSVAVMMLDVDEFKKINDSYGHHAGDQTLKSLGKMISDTVRLSDIAGRLGGDEFIFCLPNTSAEGAKVLANRLIAMVSAFPFIFEGKQIKVGLSIGVHAQVLDSDYDVSDLFKQADLALYEAKRKGKNQVQ